MSAAAGQEEQVELVPRFILPDIMVIKELERARAEAAKATCTPEEKAKLDAKCKMCEEHLRFQAAVKAAHCVLSSTLASEEQPHLQAVSIAARTIAPEPNQTLGDMMHKWDRNYPVETDSKATPQFTMLPGTVVQPDHDTTTKQTYQNALDVYQYYREVHNRDSLDNRHLNLKSSVHFGDRFANAFWTARDIQMVYGDGNEELMHLVDSLDVAGHEMTHGVIDRECRLVYQNESGALNESIADVFGMMVKQWKNKTTVADSDWLLGPGTVPEWGKALRSFKDESANIHDMQLKNYDGIEEWKEENARLYKLDSGGVHQLSGIPNNAYYRFCLTFQDDGYTAYDGLPAKIWYGVVVGKKITSRCDFYTFAQLTVDKAQELGGDDVAQNLTQSWSEVGIYLGENQAVRASRAATKAQAK